MAENSKEAAVRARAYQLWEESGRADGSQDAHWRQAEREIAERNGQPAPADPAPARSGSATGSHSDGMSRHPSVLDPGPKKGEG
jgi:hypothetical protein